MPSQLRIALLVLLAVAVAVMPVRRALRMGITDCLRHT